jgi:hypothetical protein
MTTFIPTMLYGTGTAVQRTPGSFSATIRAMLRMLSGRGEFSPMKFFVTRNAEGNPMYYVAVKHWVDMTGGEPELITTNTG